MWLFVFFRGFFCESRFQSFHHTAWQCRGPLAAQTLRTTTLGGRRAVAVVIFMALLGWSGCKNKQIVLIVGGDVQLGR